MRQAITEKDGLQKTWMEEAKKMTQDKIPEFMRKLSEDYEHDYGTICHAIAAAGIAAMNAFERGPQGGITGFQASAIIWEVIRGWGVFGDGPLSMRQWNNLLYPQYEDYFTQIPKDVWERTVAEAKKNVANKEMAAERVRQHWQSIADGTVPFGLTVSDED